MSSTRSDDLRVLTMLDLRDGVGLNRAMIGERFGMSKSAVAGALYRIDIAEQPCACVKPENKDGGMPRGWWK